MVRFNQTAKPRNFLARREQRRLLMLVVGLGLVVILILEARKPENWEGFLSMFEADQSESDERMSKNETKEPFKPVWPAEVPGSFVSSPPLDDSLDDSGEYFPGVRPGYFVSIKDGTPWRSSEHYAWLHLAEVLRDAKEEDLEKGSEGNVTYAQLDRQPNTYRGKLVTVAGTVRRAMPSAFPKNDMDFKRYYQLVISPDSNPREPMILYSLHLPKDFPEGMQISERAVVTGFFFKQMVYPSKEGATTAPTLFSRTIEWQPEPPPPPPEPFDWTALAVVCVVALSLSVFVVVYVYMRTRNFKRQ